jgi:uncharacterized RDD family membrane protein YckC
MGLSDSTEHDEITVIEPSAGYAGFWKRSSALIIDALIINAAVFVIGIVAVIGLPLFLADASVPEIEFLHSLAGLLVYWLYYAILESSDKQATFGKRALGIKVTDLRGNRLEFRVASNRWVGRLLSTLTCGVGFFMAAFTRRKQTLHDILAGCLVVNAEIKLPSMLR